MREAWVYRISDPSGMPRYVGCSVNVPERLKEHKASGTLRRGDTVTTDGPYERTDALERERALIKHLRPTANIQDNPEARVGLTARQRDSIPADVWFDDHMLPLVAYRLHEQDRRHAATAGSYGQAALYWCEDWCCDWSQPTPPETFPWNCEGHDRSRHLHECSDYTKRHEVYREHWLATRRPLPAVERQTVTCAALRAHRRQMRRWFETRAAA